MMCIVIIAQYADCTPCGFGSRQRVRSAVHPRAAILHFEWAKVARCFLFLFQPNLEVRQPACGVPAPSDRTPTPATCCGRQTAGGPRVTLGFHVGLAENANRLTFVAAHPPTPQTLLKAGAALAWFSCSV